MSLAETAKDIYELLKKGANLEAEKRLIKLSEEALELQKENLRLRDKVTELEDKLRVKENLRWDGSVYWLTNPDGSKDGPYCQRCYDKDGTLARLREWDEEFWGCSLCKQSHRRR